VRLDLDNPGFVLRPDMFVDVEFDLREPEGISVPVDAVLDSGRRRVVFISKGDGAFEPREVATGARYGDRVQVLKGLQEGETVVVSGLFLLDSESRLQSAATASAAKPNTVAAASTDPVCGMEVEPSKAAYQSQHQGTTYFFCSKDCKAKFDSDPSRFVKKQADPMKPGAS
jgi:YHS domain-containing protein